LEAGYAESGRVVAKLIGACQVTRHRAGRERLRFSCLDEGDGRMKGIVLQGGQRIRSDFVLMTVGAWDTVSLAVHTKVFRATGQPVFHLKPLNRELFAPERFSVFWRGYLHDGLLRVPAQL